jgi:uncharacterized membrane protein
MIIQRYEIHIDTFGFYQKKIWVDGDPLSKPTSQTNSMCKTSFTSIYMFILHSSYKLLTASTITLVFTASLLSTQYYWVSTKTGWLWIRIVCPSGVTFVHAKCCFSELALCNKKKPNKQKQKTKKLCVLV